MSIVTVTGPVPAASVRLADAHGHVWIHPPVGASVQLALEHEANIRAELTDFFAADGSLIVDCQPGECGRDANKLRDMSQATGVCITATTGFHKRQYYSPDHWLWSASLEAAAAYFITELTVGMRESSDGITATTIKVGYEGVIEGQAGVLMSAVAEAARQTGALVLFHSERGRNVEKLIPFFAKSGIPAQQLYICHVDKRPDPGLHRELAQAGVLLGYDSFVRPKYEPEKNVWPLLRNMVEAGYHDSIAIGLDLALASMWRHYGGEPGLLALAKQILPRLRREGFGAETIRQLTAQNIAMRLVQQNK